MIAGVLLVVKSRPGAPILQKRSAILGGAGLHVLVVEAPSILGRQTLNPHQEERVWGVVCRRAAWSAKPLTDQLRQRRLVPQGPRAGAPLSHAIAQVGRGKARRLLKPHSRFLDAPLLFWRTMRTWVLPII